MTLRSLAINLSALFILAMQVGAQATHSTAPKSPPSVVTISDQDNGKDIDLPQGATLLVKLTSNPSTGYSWAVKGDPSPLKLEKTSTKKGKQSSKKVGAPGVQELRFVANSAGMASLTLEYRRPWEYTASPAKTFSVRVNVR
jgi:inhibitor of cysteine peptidase